MLKLKSILISSLLTLVVGLAMVLALTDIQAVQADSADQPVVTTVDTSAHYLSLTDAPAQRDITSQSFAPYED